MLALTANNMYTTIISGTITMKNGYTTAPPGTTSSAGHYLPRMGDWREGPPYIPASSFRGVYRRACSDLVKSVKDITEIAPLMVARMGYSGKGGITVPGTDIMKTNPMLVFGAFKAASMVMIDNMVFHPDVRVITREGARKDDYKDNPEMVDYLSEQGQMDLKMLRAGETNNSAAKKKEALAEAEAKKSGIKYVKPKKAKTDEDDTDQSVAQVFKFQHTTPNATADFRMKFPTLPDITCGMLLRGWEQMGMAAQIGGHRATHGEMAVDLTVYAREAHPTRKRQFNNVAIGTIKTINGDPSLGIEVTALDPRMQVWLDAWDAEEAAGGPNLNAEAGLEE